MLYVVAYIDRVNVGFAALQMNEDLGLSDAMYGFGAGIFFVGYAMFEVPSNLILARIGPRLWITRIMVTWGALSVAMMWARSPESFYVLRFLLGVAEAGFFPGIIYYLCDWFPQKQRARAVAWFMTAIPMATVIGGPLAGFLLGLDGRGGLAGWQWLFLVEGLPAVILGVVVLFYLDDKPEDARWLRDDEKAWLVREIRSEQARARERHQVGILAALAHPVVWVLGFINLVLQTGSYGLALWVPQIIKGFGGLTNLEVGFIAAVPFAFAAVGMVLIGRSSDRSGERFWHLAVTLFVAALGFAASALVKSPLPALALLTVTAVADLGGRGPFWALPSRFLAGSASAAGIALINTFGAIGGFVGPNIIGVMKGVTDDYTGGLMLLAGIVLMGALAAVWLRRARTLAPRPP
ncbi:MAG TPA: MFS transporter [Steroidobacteraceae bacterium]|nr:MFS transporter [Steroidobacteraceae bacterium]